MPEKKSEKRIKKEKYWKKLWDLTDQFKKALLVDVDNVSSKQITKIRFKLRSIDAVMLMGKNVKPSFNLVDPDEGLSLEKNGRTKGRR